MLLLFTVCGLFGEIERTQGCVGLGPGDTQSTTSASLVPWVRSREVGVVWSIVVTESVVGQNRVSGELPTVDGVLPGAQSWS